MKFEHVSFERRSICCNSLSGEERENIKFVSEFEFFRMVLLLELRIIFNIKYYIDFLIIMISRSFNWKTILETE